MRLRTAILLYSFFTMTIASTASAMPAQQELPLPEGRPAELLPYIAIEGTKAGHESSGGDEFVEVKLSSGGKIYYSSFDGKLTMAVDAGKNKSRQEVAQLQQSGLALFEHAKKALYGVPQPVVSEPAPRPQQVQTTTVTQNNTVGQCAQLLACYTELNHTFCPQAGEQCQAHFEMAAQGETTENDCAESLDQLAFVLQPIVVSTANFALPLTCRRASAPLPAQTASTTTTTTTTTVTKTDKSKPDTDIAVILPGGTLSLTSGNKKGKTTQTTTTTTQVTTQPAPAPVVVQSPPPPVAPIADTRAMSNSEYQALLESVEEASFTDDRKEVVSLAAKNNYFTCKQVTELLQNLSFSDERIHALRAMAPKIVDRKNSHLVLNAFEFSSERKQAEQILSN